MNACIFWFLELMLLIAFKKALFSFVPTPFNDKMVLQKILFSRASPINIVTSIFWAII